MITPTMIDQFLSGTRGQALRHGTRYAQEARVGGFVGSLASATTLVRGETADFEVALWPEMGGLAHRCSCPSWRDPCKHEVAAALVLKQCLPKGLDPPADPGGGRARASRTPPVGALPQPAAAKRPAGREDEARDKAIEERRTAARREKLPVAQEDPPYLRVGSSSGFAYRVQVRGDATGPHSCDCPDFEANRLHTCKHVERARTYLHTHGDRLGRAHRQADRAARIFLHFGEIVEPRLFGSPSGPGAPAVRAAFDASGLPLRPLARDESELRDWLARFGGWVEPEALEWLDRRIRRRPALPDRDLPDLLPQLPLKPYPYQWTGAAFLAQNGRALLADEMGLGKTVQALLAAVALRKATPPARHVIIVCPASLRGGWQDELRKWIGEEAELLTGNAIERARLIASRPAWLITHYEQVLRDHKAHQEHPPDLLIIDEAQRAKGLRARTARVLKSIESRYLFALTGTPLENRLEEAYAIAQLIDQRLLPPLWQIDRDHFTRDDKGRRVVLYRNLDALRAKLAPAFLRRRKEDVALQLPERVRSVVKVPMHPAVEATYDDVMGAVARIASKKVILPADLDRMQRLLVIARRCCNGPHMLGLEARQRDDRKVPKLAELEQALSDLCLGEGRKAVVFSEWTDMTDRVEDLCGRLRLTSFHLHGGVPIAKRPMMIRAFMGSEGAAVFISTDAGGVGLNLQAADVVINLDLPWNPARLEQRVARVHRIGSRRAVTELLIVCENSVEERILQLHDTKRNVLANIWAKSGEDQIAAPGGSGMFREMVLALLAARAPVISTGQKARDDRAKAQAGEAGESRRESGATKPVEPVHAPADQFLPAAAAGVIAAARGEAAPPRLGEPAPALAPPPPPTLTPAGVDPAALASAVAAVAPTLPADHRSSLATVFRALAAALEG